MTQTISRNVETNANLLKHLQLICEEARSDTIETLGAVGSGHSGPSLSIIEILVTLYFKEIEIDPDRPKWDARDRFVLSKGHGALGYYAVLSPALFSAR